MNAPYGLIVDLFAGGGGASTGIEAALGRRVDIAINHDATALAVHARNHPKTRHIKTDIFEVKPLDATGGRPVDLLWASPDCRHFSVAKGGKPVSKKVRSLAWVVTAWAHAVRPKIICLENVPEFRTWGPLGKDGKPIKARAGETFRKWRRRLEKLGYVVDFRILDASQFGAPTKRRRLFLVARCDGQPIRWPKPTHGPGLKPLHAAAECIDWDIPCPSIFGRKKPLAEKTLWRVAQGIKRFVLENPQPFVVSIDHQSTKDTSSPAVAPLSTVTTKARHAVVTASIVGVGGRAGQSEPTGLAQPVGTVTAKNDRALVSAALVEMNHSNAPHGVTEPLGTVTTQHNRFNLVAPTLVKVNHGGETADRSEDIDAPLSTVTAARRGHALVAPTLIQTGYGEREGQRPRYLNIHEPLGTVVADGQKHALVSAFVAKHFGGVVGNPVTEPTGAITTKDHHGLASATLLKLRGECAGADLNEPAPTLTAGGTHLSQVIAFLTAYYSSGSAAGQDVGKPLRTLTTKDRLGLVTIKGVDYQIVDIGLRMLQPHELKRAQFGRFADATDLSDAKTMAAKVRLIGNSVPPEVAEALVIANTSNVATDASATQFDLELGHV